MQIVSYFFGGVGEKSYFCKVLIQTLSIEIIYGISIYRRIANDSEPRGVRDAFIASYLPSRGSKVDNAFTKKKMEQTAHFALDAYFAANLSRIESWFNVISPNGGTLQDLKQILVTLKNKDWRTIL